MNVILKTIVSLSCLTLVLSEASAKSVEVVPPPPAVNPADINVADISPRCFTTVKEARKFYDEILKSNGKQWSGNVALHGRRVQWFRRTGPSRRGGWGSSRWVQYSHNTCGTILALPDEEFMIRDVFICDDGVSVSTGGVVSVGVKISGVGQRISEAVKQQTIKNLAFSGMAVRGNGDNPGGRLLSLKQSSKKRFGAKSNELYLGFEPGQVYIVLYDCDLEEMDEEVTPLSMFGNKSNEYKGK